MKQKFILTSDNTEVFIGDTLISPDVTIKVNSATIPILVEKGIIAVVKEKVSIEYFIKILAMKYDFTTSGVYSFLEKLEQINPSAAYSILINEIALWMDNKYPDHIKKQSNLYMISMLSGEITKATSKIKTYRHVPLFRSVEDAQEALSIMKDFHKELF